MLEVGDRVLLFLRPEESGVHPIVEYSLGMFWEVDVGGRAQLLREPSLQAGGATHGGATVVESAGVNLPPRRRPLPSLDRRPGGGSHEVGRLLRDRDGYRSRGGPVCISTHQDPERLSA